MGTMYDKFVGPGSLNNAALRLELHDRDGTVRSSGSARSPGVQLRAPSIDSGDRASAPPAPGLAVAIAAAGASAAVQSAALTEQLAAQQQQAISLATRKYVAPNIARKYGIQQHIKPASAAAAAAATAAPAALGDAGAGRGGRGGGGGSAPSPRSPRIGAAASLTPRSGRGGSGGSDSSSQSGAGGGGASASGDVYDARAAGPRPQSAAFRAVPRERAKCQGTKFLYGGPSGVPGPAKYTPKYGAVEKDSHALAWGRSDGSGERSCAWRPGSAPAAGRSAPSPPRRSHGEDGTGGGGGGDDAATFGRSRSLGGAAAAAAAAEAARQAAVRHAELFGGAHRVHPRKPPRPPGTQSFMAAARRPPDVPAASGTLFAEYYREGYDSLTRKSSRPSSAFGTQTSRPAMAPGSLPAQLAGHGETGPALGPGSYGAKGALPGTHTGRHVPAGHSTLARTPDWSRGSSRPCSASAPPARPQQPPQPPALALQPGYWGPNGPAASLFPDDPEYSELVALRLIQEQVAQREVSQAFRPHSPSRPVSAASAAARIPTADGGGGGGGFGGGEGGRPLVYVDPQQHGQLTSAGLAPRVPGGAFGRASREGAAHALRAMSDARITPPGAVAVRAAQDLSYTYDATVEGHRSRSPSWSLPPNRAALSSKWVGAAASALLETMAS